ncbi:DUF4404 family protein [Pontiella sp.]|uniref:DUF4404 family protein n=1 Tax=Pontiella sp. TaxID=2837462 RepID=UPI003565C967
MPHKEIKKTIEELKGELQKTEQDTGPFEEILHNAQEGLERYTPEAVQELADALKREAAEFEVEHPRITALINNVMTHLSNLGI